MSTFKDNYDRLSRLLYVVKSIGNAFLKSTIFTTIVRRFVDNKHCNEIEGHDRNDTHAAKCFTAETESLLFMYPSLLSSERSHFNEFHDFTLKSGQPLATVLLSDKENCRHCRGKLAIDSKSHPVVIYSLHRGTYLGCRLIKHCKKCKIHEHYGYWTESGERHYDESVLKLEFLQSSEDTAFDMNLLKECSNLLTLGALPFSTYSATYNRRFGYNKNTTHGDNSHKAKRMKRETAEQLKEMLNQRESLDRRRLEEAFLLMACLEAIKRYNLWQEVTKLPYDHNDMVEEVAKHLSKAFVKKWGDHVCDTPGCKSVLVLDGNMKNARQVCMLKDVGQLQFPEIPGAVVVGCQNTPAKASRYCATHTGTAMVFRDDLSSDTIPTATPHKSDKPGSLIIKVLNEKETRQGKIFEVLWSDGRKSWLKLENLPPKIQDCLRKALPYQQRTVTINEFGQRRTEFILSPSVETNIDCSIVKSSGFAIENDEDQKIPGESGQQRKMTCGTEKGRHKSKNHRTAGILAVAKTCSIVIDVKELFGSESKSQVYAHLHHLLQQLSLHKIDTLCYDDACHLKKFVNNTKRRNLTPTAQRMAQMNIVCDRFHFKNHTDAWCRKNCNPHNTSALEDVNTEVCEQVFSWLSKFAHVTKHMNRWRFLFLILYILDNHNNDVEQGLKWQ